MTLLLRRCVLQGIVALPTATLPVTTRAAPSDLARAINMTVDRAASADRPENTIGWTDEQWDEELDAQGAVWRRAIAEPSAGLQDISAKARLALDDLDRFTPEKMDDSDPLRLLRVLLREVIALCA